MRAFNKVLQPAKLEDGTIINRRLIGKRCRELASSIQAFYGKPDLSDPLTVPLIVEIKFGAFMVYPALLSCFHVEFPTYVGCIRAKSYRKNGLRGDIEISNSMFDCDIQGRKVLLVDDIVESGQTLSALRDWFVSRGASDVRTFALLDKPSQRKWDIEVDWSGFRLAPNQWVVGFGLDDNNLFRHFNNIVVVCDKKATLSKPR